MDRQMLMDHLAQAERHVAEGAETISRQVALVGELERDGHNTTLAKALLLQFQEMLAMHMADRDRLRKELGD